MPARRYWPMSRDVALVMIGVSGGGLFEAASMAPCCLRPWLFGAAAGGLLLGAWTLRFWGGIARRRDYVVSRLMELAMDARLMAFEGRPANASGARASAEEMLPHYMDRCKTYVEAALGGDRAADLARVAVLDQGGEAWRVAMSYASWLMTEARNVRDGFTTPVRMG